MSSFDEELRELALRNEEKFQATIKKIGSYIPVFIAICIALWWLFYDAIEVESIQLNFAERFGLMLLTIFLSMVFRSLIANGGYASAKNTKTFLDAEANYEETASNALEKQKQILAYANDVASKNLYECRKSNLEANGLRYSDFFDKDGNYIGCDYKHANSLNLRQKLVINKAIKQRVILPSLFGYISSKWFGLKKEHSQKEHQAKTAIYNLLFGVFASFISVGVTFRFIGISIDSLIYAFAQILLWTASGYIQRLQNFNFILDVIVPLYKEKTHIINSYFALSEDERNKYEDNNKRLESEVVDNEQHS